MKNWSVRKKLNLGLILIAAILAAILAIRFHSEIQNVLHDVTNRQQLVNDFQHRGPLDFFLFTVLLIVMTWIPGAPYAIVAIVAGVCFGHWTGFFMNVVAATLGNFSTASVLPLITKDSDRRSKSRLYQDLLQIKHPSFGLTLGYAIPFIPSTAVNMASATLIRSRAHLFLICLVGSLPTAAIYAFGGDATLHGNALRVAIISIIAVLLFGVIIVIHRDRKDKNAA